MELEDKFVARSNGVHIPFVEQGSPSGIPVVLLHGVTDSWRSFEGVLPYLPPSIHALVPINRSHGSALRNGLAAISSIAPRIDSIDPTVGNVCDNATRTVIDPSPRNVS